MFRHRQWLDSVLTLVADSEGATTGDEHRQRRTRLEKLGAETGRRWQGLLDVVEHQQPPRPSGGLMESFANRALISLENADCPGHRRGDLRGIGARGHANDGYDL